MPAKGANINPAPDYPKPPAPAPPPAVSEGKSITPQTASGVALLKLLQAKFGVPKTAREIVITISVAAPITIEVEYLPIEPATS